MGDNKYEELARAQIQNNREVVISAFGSGGYTMAQHLFVLENKFKTSVSLKGAFHIDTIEGLYNLRDALNIAIQIAENKKK